MTAAAPHRPRRWWPILALGYLALLSGVVWSVFAARDWALAEMATTQSNADWEAWREDVRAQQTQPAPVQRRVPKSAEPPALVLMRDHFAVCLAGAVLFSSLLYWVIAWLGSGMLSSGRSFPGPRSI